MLNLHHLPPLCLSRAARPASRQCASRYMNDVPSRASLSPGGSKGVGSPPPGGGAAERGSPSSMSTGSASPFGIRKTGSPSFALGVRAAGSPTPAGIPTTRPSVLPPVSVSNLGFSMGGGLQRSPDWCDFPFVSVSYLVPDLINRHREMWKCH